MTPTPDVVGDVVGQGDDRPRGRTGSLLAGAATLALLAVGVAGALRSPDGPDARTPSPSPSAATPTSGSGWTGYGSRDPFEVHVGAARPPDGSVQPLTLDRGLPVFLVARDGEVRAYEAIGGPSHTRSLVGWCPKNATFQDPAGQYVYVDGVGPYPTPPLRTYPVRPSSGPPDHVDIGLSPLPDFPRNVVADAGCDARELVMPLLPGLARTAVAVRHGWVRMRGTYTVTTESRKFCSALPDMGCQSADWPSAGPGAVLAPGDLAGSYTYDGEFLVSARDEPILTVVLTPASRLVRRERVGTAVRVGWAESSYERGGALHLRFNPFAVPIAEIPDDSPPGTPKENGQYTDLADRRGGLRDIVLAPDAEVHLPPSYTGRTPAALAAYLRRNPPYTTPPLWLVFDRSGRVIRVVSERALSFRPVLDVAGG